MSTGRTITITTVPPYTTIPDYWKLAAGPPITGQRTVWAPYVRGDLAAHPTTYAVPVDEDEDDYTVTHLPSGMALAITIPRAIAVQLVDAWQSVDLANLVTYADFFSHRAIIGGHLRAAALAVGLDWPYGYFPR